MERIHIDLTNHQRVINRIVAVLRRGGVVVFPTDTAYGMCADATNQKAIEKIFNIKGRGPRKALSMFMTSKAMFKQYARMTRCAQLLWDQFLPGPLTIVVPLKSDGRLLGSSVIQDGAIGVRVSPHPLVHTVVKKIGRPITATSANRAGADVLYDIEQVINSFKNRAHQPDLVIDAGVLPKQKVSSVVSCLRGDTVRILRKGAISEREIKSALQ
jgi:L-threonylcarbamoyladenylate synthase